MPYVIKASTRAKVDTIAAYTDAHESPTDIAVERFNVEYLLRLVYRMMQEFDAAPESITTEPYKEWKQGDLVTHTNGRTGTFERVLDLPTGRKVRVMVYEYGSGFRAEWDIADVTTMPASAITESRTK